MSQAHIENVIVELNPKKATGYDAVPPKILKDSVKIITELLTQLFNTSANETFFPCDLKYANVTPTYKKDDCTNKENYRPISILPSISKIFERILSHQMISYVNNIISSYLCGFRKGYNPQHALLRLVNNLNKSLDHKKGRTSHDRFIKSI